MPKSAATSFNPDNLIACMLAQEVCFVLKDDTSFLACLNGLWCENDQLNAVFRHVRLANRSVPTTTTLGDRFSIQQNEIVSMSPVLHSDGGKATPAILLQDMAVGLIDKSETEKYRTASCLANHALMADTLDWETNHEKATGRSGDDGSFETGQNVAEGAEIDIGKQQSSNNKLKEEVETDKENVPTAGPAQSFEEVAQKGVSGEHMETSKRNFELMAPFVAQIQRKECPSYAAVLMAPDSPVSVHDVPPAAAIVHSTSYEIVLEEESFAAPLHPKIPPGFEHVARAHLTSFSDHRNAPAEDVDYFPNYETTSQEDTSPTPLHPQIPPGFEHVARARLAPVSVRHIAPPSVIDPTCMYQTAIQTDSSPFSLHPKIPPGFENVARVMKSKENSRTCWKGHAKYAATVGIPEETSEDRVDLESCSSKVSCNQANCGTRKQRRLTSPKSFEYREATSLVPGVSKVDIRARSSCSDSPSRLSASGSVTSFSGLPAAYTLLPGSCMPPTSFEMTRPAFPSTLFEFKVALTEGGTITRNDAEPEYMLLTTDQGQAIQAGTGTFLQTLRGAPPAMPYSGSLSNAPGQSTFTPPNAYHAIPPMGHWPCSPYVTPAAPQMPLAPLHPGNYFPSRTTPTEIPAMPSQYWNQWNIQSGGRMYPTLTGQNFGYPSRYFYAQERSEMKRM